jgi:2-polyprenyl-3-methyl-5-hydroxy-6-metoxy-1,4-benzoquinol methylase
LATIALGDRLGLYRVIADRGPSTTAEVAAATGHDHRYLREWCEQQAAAGLLLVDTMSGDGDPGTRRFALPPGSEAVLLDPESPAYLVPITGFLESVARVMQDLESAFRTGRGIPYGDYQVQHVQGAFNRPAFTGQLVQEWLPQIPDLHATLGSGGAVAEFGCGEGWAAIALAKGYPGVRVDAFDVDGPSVEAARRHAADAGVGDRIRFVVADVADPALAGRYDAVFAFEVVHDLAHPVEALRAARRLADAGRAPVIVMDERTDERFSAPASPVERFLYASSVLHCLPVGRAEDHSAATGTMMRPDVLRRYAAEAGFATTTILPIEHDLFRFYRLQG